MNSLVYHAGKFINDDDLNSPEAAVAHRSWELSKYTSEELKDELASREERRIYISSPNSLKQFADFPEQHEVCKHDMEMGYCEVRGCAGSY